MTMDYIYYFYEAGNIYVKISKMRGAWQVITYIFLLK